MKKLFASVALGTILLGGLLFMQDNQPTDVAHGEAEPTIYKMSVPSVVNM